MPAVAQSFLSFAGSETDDSLEGSLVDPTVVLSLCVNAVESATLACWMSLSVFEEEAGIFAGWVSCEYIWRK